MLLSSSSAKHLLRILVSEGVLPPDSACIACIAVDSTARERFLQRYGELVSKASNDIPMSHSKIVLSALERLREFVENFAKDPENPPQWIKEALVEFTLCAFLNAPRDSYCVDSLGSKYFEKILRELPVFLTDAVVDKGSCVFLIKPSREELEILKRASNPDGSPLPFGELIRAVYGASLLPILELMARRFNMDVVTPSVDVFGVRFYPSWDGLLNLLDRLGVEGEKVEAVAVKAIEEMLERKGIRGYRYVGKENNALVFESREAVSQLLPNPLNIDRIYLYVYFHHLGDMYFHMGVKVSENAEIVVGSPRMVTLNQLPEEVEALLGVFSSVLKKWAEPIYVVAEEAMARGYVPILGRAISKEDEVLLLVFSRSDGRIERRISMRIKSDRMDLITLSSIDLSGLMVDRQALSRSLSKILSKSGNNTNYSSREYGLQGTTAFIRTTVTEYRRAVFPNTVRSCLDYLDRAKEILEEVVEGAIRDSGVDERDSLTAIALYAYSRKRILPWGKIEQIFKVKKTEIYRALTAVLGAVDRNLLARIGGSVDTSSFSEACKLILRSSFVSLDVDGSVLINGKRIRDLLPNKPEPVTQDMEDALLRTYMEANSLYLETLEAVLSKFSKEAPKRIISAVKNIIFDDYIRRPQMLKITLGGKPVVEYLSREERKALVGRLSAPECVEVLADPAISNLLQEYRDEMVKKVLSKGSISEKTRLFLAVFPEAIGLEKPQQNRYIEVEGYMIAILSADGVDRDSLKAFAVCTHSDKYCYTYRARTIQEVIESARKTLLRMDTIHKALAKKYKALDAKGIVLSYQHIYYIGDTPEKRKIPVIWLRNKGMEEPLTLEKAEELLKLVQTKTATAEEELT